MNKIEEKLLLEKSRAQLLDKGKNADIVKSYGTTRYGRKDYQHVFKATSNLNRIDFNALFKADLLSFKLPVQGETNSYEVEILFDKACTSIRQQVISNNNVCEYKCIYRAIVNAINNSDIFVSCTCSDFKYRQAYYASRGRYNSGQPQIVPSKVTNPNDTKGSGCKHIMKVLADLD